MSIFLCLLLLSAAGRLGATRLETSVCVLSMQIITPAMLRVPVLIRVIPSTPQYNTVCAGASRSTVSPGIPTITPGDSVIPGILPPGGQATYQVPSSACEGDRYAVTVNNRQSCSQFWAR